MAPLCRRHLATTIGQAASRDSVPRQRYARPCMEASGNGTRVTTQQRRARLRLTLFLAAGIAAAGVMLGLYAVDALKSLELRSVDTRFSVRGTQPQPKDLAVVAIDIKTFNDLKIQWPFPRGRHAKVLDR